MRDYEETCRRLDRRKPAVLAELHHELRKRVMPLLAGLGGRLTPWEGFRDRLGQALARQRGHSNAEWGESPHNWQPALAVDVVLDPRRVTVRPHLADPERPDLWDDESPEAVAAWRDLEIAAPKEGLERVVVMRRGVARPDLPHLQLHSWRSYIPH